MQKYFNTQGPCNPQAHYMVNLEQRLCEIKNLIDKNKYFSIHCGRQYGKTTTLLALENYLKDDYITASLDFQLFTQNAFQDEASFSQTFANEFGLSIQSMSGHTESAPATDIIGKCADGKNCSMRALFERLGNFCALSEKPVVLIIDEVDSALDNQVFRDFLSLLRGYYIRRDRYPAFQSVILAGVYDIGRMKEKLRPGEDHRKNSPWNIAVDFDIDMNLDMVGIQEMLCGYENDFRTGMDIAAMAGMLYGYTSGHPFLVSRLCQLIDEKITGRPEFPDRSAAWTKDGFLEAEKTLLAEKNTLFESLIHKLTDYPRLRELLHAILFSGDRILYNPDNEIIDTAFMFGFVKNANGTMQVSNRIFETRLYNFFLSEEDMETGIFSNVDTDKNQFVQNGILNMELVLKKFMIHWNDLYCSADEKFMENNCRKFFLLYLKPIINGVGNYYIESHTRDRRRTDVIVDYCGRQYIIELKLWRGEEYNRRGQKQLADYLETYHMSKGYLLSFNFNKNKTSGIKETVYGNKTIFEAVV